MIEDRQTRYPTIVVDGTRLFWGAWDPTPRGIDRVDYGFTLALIENWPGDFISVATTPWGLRFFTRRQSRRHLQILADIWRETISLNDDHVYAALSNWLATGAASKHLNVHLKDRGRAYRLLINALRGPLHIASPARPLQRPSIYLNLGQSTFGRVDVSKWLKQNIDCRVIAMVHDLIPIEHPELVSPSATSNHRVLMQQLADSADLIITPSQTVERSVATHLKLHCQRQPPVFGSRLPTDAIFNAPPINSGHGPQPRPYFISCGTIEPRKNQALLLDVWRELASIQGDNTPALVLAGSVGFRGEPVLEQITKDAILAKHVIVAAGLSTVAVAKLIAGAQALLMPSLAEGFGLPPVEALTLGTIAIVSDIPAHREGTRGCARYIDATRKDEWLKAILSVEADNRSNSLGSKIDRAFMPRSWDTYLHEMIKQFLAL